jgi:8-oxo-dGTP pyrophosphatase MutT (NUDIX family)
MFMPENVDADRIPPFITGLPAEPDCVSLPVSDPATAFEAFRKQFRNIEAAGGLVARTTGHDLEYLLIFRLGKWDLPKGKMDRGEMPRQTAVREIEEECGIGKLTITGELPVTWHMYQLRNEWVIKKTYWYTMTTTDRGKLVPAGDEGIEKAEWMDSKSVMKLLPAAYASIADLLREALSGR